MLKSLLLTNHLSHLQAALYATLAYLLFTLSDGMGKFLMMEGFTKAQVLTLTSIPSFIALSLLMIKRRGFSKCYHTHYKFFHVLRALSILSVTFFVFEALKHLPMADFYGISFSAPFLVTIGAFIFFKEKTSLTEWAAIALGFGGVLIVVQPDYDHFNIGYIYAILGVVSLAAAGLIVRKIGRDEDPYLFVIFANLAIILFNIYPALSHAWPENITLNHIIIFTIYSAIIPTAILTLSAVFARAPTITAVVPFQYLQIVWGAIFGYFVFSDIPQVNTIVGSGVVIAAGLYILFHHQRQNKKSK